MKTLALLGLLNIGCMGWTMPIAGEGYDGPTNPQNGQDVALNIVWHQLYHQDSDGPPIMWHFNDTCVDQFSKNGAPWGTRPAFKNPHADLCSYGAYESSGWVETTEYDAPNRADLEWLGSFSQSSFAHELCHAFKQYTTGDGDENHTSNCFSAEGHPYVEGLTDIPGSLVHAANEALRNAGL